MNKVMFSDQKAIHWIVIGALICSIYVILGAFGAHGLEPHLSSKDLKTYQTGLRYMIIHGLGLILINLVFNQFSKFNRWVNWLIVIGILLFSVSLIIHGTRNLLHLDINVFAAFAPIGGLSFILAWILFAYS
ncbi:MAG: DUF423 domain-containing protein, partial [Bacteroidia bacterium]|nr:DUF423 domain-containing protein [Bacteroidia bacterium]